MHNFPFLVFRYITMLKNGKKFNAAQVAELAQQSSNSKVSGSESASESHDTDMEDLENEETLGIEETPGIEQNQDFVTIVLQKEGDTQVHAHKHA